MPGTGSWKRVPGPLPSAPLQEGHALPRCVMVLLALMFFFVGVVEGQYRSPSIIEHPADVLVGRDEPATLNCHADGRPEPTITWYKNGRPLQSATAGGHHLVLASGDLFFLRVRQDDTNNDAGTYWCVAANTVSSARSNNATLEIAVLNTEFLAVPRNSRVAEGEVAMLECRPPAGSPAPVVTWLRDGGQLDPAVNHRYRVSPSGELVITSARVGDSGSYTCQARNAYATRSAPAATLTVLVKPHLVSSSGSVTASAGATVELVCRVGGDPPPEVFWGRVIPAGAQLPLERLVQEERGQVLRLRHVSSEDQGVYSCTAENPVGLVAANTSLTVHSRPVFTKKPKDARVGIDGTARFACSVSGSPEPSTYWIHEGSGLLASVGQSWAGGRVRVGADNSLSIGGVREEDTGHYACVAVGEAGSAIARAYLEVQGVSDMPPPIIAVGATNQTLPLHTEAELPCEARGTPEPAVTWSKDGRLLDTASMPRHSVTPLGTLRITTLQQSDSGLYTCIASNIAGSSQWQAALAVHKATNPNISFNKMFWHSDLPEPPQNLRILAVNETQVTLGWSRGRSGSSSVRGHSVQYWSPDLRGPWRDGATVTPSHYVPTPRATTVTNLMANTRYVFTIRSRNKDWVSRPSVFTHVIRTLDNHGLENGVGEGDSDLALRDVRNKLSSPSLRLVSVEAVSSTSLKVSWRVLVNDLKTLEGVHIRYRPLDPQKNQPSGALGMETIHFSLRGENHRSVLPSSSGEVESNKVPPQRPSGSISFLPHEAPNSYTITNLRPGTGYLVFVVPFYRSIEGQPTAAVRRTTLPAPVLATPTGLHYRVVNGTSVKVEWDPSSQIMGDRSRKMEYNLQVVNVEEMSHPIILNITTNTTFVVVPNLPGSATYEFTVRTVLGFFHGPPSEVLRFTPTWETVATKPVPNESPVPTTTDANNAYIITAIVCAAILVFCFLLAAVIWIHKKRSFTKCPHYFSKENESSGPWSAYSGCWEDGTNTNGISTARYSDGTVTGMNNTRFTDLGGTLTDMKNVHYTKNVGTVPGTNVSIYTDAEGQFYAAADTKGGYESRPLEDLMYEDPEGLRLVSFKGRESNRCHSPEPYATTPLISAGGELAYPCSLNGSNPVMGGTRLPPNIPLMTNMDASHNFKMNSDKGLSYGPVLQFPPAPKTFISGGEEGNTTASSSSRGDNSNPSRGGSCQHLLLQHLPYGFSGSSSNHPTGSSSSSHQGRFSGANNSPLHPSLMMQPRRGRHKLSPNTNHNEDQVNSSHLSKPSLSNPNTSHSSNSTRYASPGTSPGMVQSHQPSVNSRERSKKINHVRTRSGPGRRLESWLTNGVAGESGMVGYPSSQGRRCSSPQSSVPGDESDYTKGDESCWSTNDDGSTSDGSSCSQQSLEPNWTEAMRLMGGRNWPESGIDHAPEEEDAVNEKTGLSCIDQEERDVKRKLLKDKHSDRFASPQNVNNSLITTGITEGDSGQTKYNNGTKNNVNDKYLHTQA